MENEYIKGNINDKLRQFNELWYPIYQQILYSRRKSYCCEPPKKISDYDILKKGWAFDYYKDYNLSFYSISYKNFSNEFALKEHIDKDLLMAAIEIVVGFAIQPVTTQNEWEVMLAYKEFRKILYFEKIKYIFVMDILQEKPRVLIDTKNIASSHTFFVPFSEKMKDYLNVKVSNG